MPVDDKIRSSCMFRRKGAADEKETASQPRSLARAAWGWRSRRRWPNASPNGAAFDPLFAGGASCAPARAGARRCSSSWCWRSAETAPFKPGQQAPSAGGRRKAAAVQGPRQAARAESRTSNRSAAGLFRPGHAADLRLQPCRSGARLPRRAAARSRLRHVLLGRGAGAGAQHQRADVPASGGAGRRSRRQGRQACGAAPRRPSRR